MSTTSRSEMEAFARVVELGGFSAAARKLGLTPSAMSKLVSRLEAHLGVRLLNRTTRKLTPIGEGALYYERCRGIVAAIEDAENEVSRSRERPRGRVRITAGVAIGTHQLVPALPRFLERYPEVEVELHIDDRTIDLVTEDLDIGLRLGPLRDASLVARKLCDLDRVLCASPGYLAKCGVPRLPADLAQHACITMAPRSGPASWSFTTPAGPVSIDVSGRVTANNAECVLKLARAGLGIIQINKAAASEDIHRGTLVRIPIESFDTGRSVLYAVYPPGRQRAPRVAAMLDFLVETFAPAPWRRQRSGPVPHPG